MGLLRFSWCVLLAVCGGVGLFAFSARANAETLDWNYPAANAAWVTYVAGTGRASAISNQNAVNGNANQDNGSITVTYPGPITVFRMRHYAGPIDNPGVAGDETNPGGQLTFIDDVTFTRSARLAISKTSTGGVGTFNFSNSNGLTFTAPSTYSYGVVPFSVTTTTAGTPVVGPSQILGIVNTSTVVTETGPAGWVVSTTTATCTDSNSAVSTNPASFTAPVTGNALTLAATNVRAGAIITCSLTNVPAAPQLTIVKTANTAGPVNSGNTIGYTYRVTNNGNVAMNNVTVGDVHNGFGIDPVPGSESLFNDVAPLGNSTDAAVNGTWNSLAPGDTIQFTGNYLVVQADIDSLQ